MRPSTRAFVALGAALLLLVFGPSLRGEFVWDDAHLLAKNADLLADGGLRRLLTSDLWGGAGSAPSQLYHPIPVFTFWLQAQLTGLRMVPMRLFNVALHLACGTLLFRVLRAREVAASVAFGAALLFLVHPSVTEPVAWLTGRHDTLGALFILLAVAAFDRTPLGAALASLACAAAFLCKEAFVIAPVLVLLFARPKRRALLVLPFLAVAAVFMLRRLLSIPTGSAMTDAPPTALAIHYATIVQHFLLQVVLVRDVPSTLTYRPLGAVAAVVVLLLTAAALVYSARDRRALGLAWFSLALAPLTLAVPMIGMWGNRYAYVPMIGLFVAGAEVVDARLRERRPSRAHVGAWVTGAALVVFALLTGFRARRFRSELLLFGADVAAAPDDPRALYHYGTAVHARGGCSESMPYFVRAAEREPSFARALRNVAGCALNLRQFDVAERAARAALGLEPDSAVHAYHLGAALAARGAVDEARAALTLAIEKDPSYAPARKLLSQLKGGG